MISDETVLWRHDDLECLMVSCCSGAELQLRRHMNNQALKGPGNTKGGDCEIVLRELYPTKSDLYERSLALKKEWVGSRV